MTSVALQRDALMPRRPSGMGPGLLLALFIHALLVVALAFSVRWRASEPQGVEAELWSAVPQIAAPKAVEPEPAPVQPEPKPEPPKPVTKAEPAPDAQIAIEKAKREEERKKREEADKLAQQKLEKEKRDKEDKRKKELEVQRAEAEHKKAVERMLAQAREGTNGGATGTSTRSAGPSASYGGRIKARIKPNIVLTDIIDGNPAATVKVRLAPDGTIVGKDWIKRSGVPAWDEAVMRAIEKTEVLPRDIDGRVPPSIEIEFKPRE